MSSSHMVEIPDGRLLMGSSRFYPEEAPVRETAVSAFAIDRDPVTVSRFDQFVAETGYVTVAERAPDPAQYPDADPSLLRPGSAVFQPTKGPVPLNDPSQWWAYVIGADWRHPWGPDSDNSNRAEHPVTHIAYADVEAYARWAGQELPTEAEWEYAARGGLEDAVFAWGDRERPNGELMANHWQGEFPWQNSGANGWRGTSPVGLFPPNGYGLNDITGNVWEWTSDPYATYSAGSEGTPSPCCQALTELRVGTSEGSHDDRRAGAAFPQRVIKGGSHLCAPNYCLRYRPAARQPESIDTSTSHIGFRCVIRGEH